MGNYLKKTYLNNILDMVLISLQSLPVMELVFNSINSSFNWSKFELKRGHNNRNRNGSGRNGNCNNRRRRYGDKGYDDYYDNYDYYGYDDNDDNADDSNDTNTNTDNTVTDYSEPETESIFGERCCSWFWVNWDS